MISLIPCRHLAGLSGGIGYPLPFSAHVAYLAPSLGYNLTMRWKAWFRRHRRGIASTHRSKRQEAFGCRDDILIESGERCRKTSPRASLVNAVGT